jgi:DprA-like N-terminal HHH domain
MAESGPAVADRAALSEDERIHWLRLIRSENVGPRGIMAQSPEALPRR